MPRILTKQLAEAEAQQVASQQVEAQGREEAVAAEAAETSFFADEAPWAPPGKDQRGRHRPLGSVQAAKAPRPTFSPFARQNAGHFPPPSDEVLGRLRGLSLQPQLDELYAVVPQLRDAANELLLKNGYADAKALQAADRRTLGRAFRHFDAAYPHSAFTRQLRQAWTLRVESNLARVAQELAGVAALADKLARKQESPQAFRSACKNCDTIVRSLAREAQQAAQAQEQLGMGELLFYQRCLALLDNDLLAAADERGGQGAGLPATLPRLCERIAALLQLGSAGARAQAAKQAGLAEDDAVGERA